MASSVLGHEHAVSSSANKPPERRRLEQSASNPQPARAGKDGTMNIGEASTQSGVSQKMIRHYESLGLLRKVPRTVSGYRLYDDASIHTLRFIRRARDLGFSIGEIEQLLALWRSKRRASADVKRIALAHAADLEQRIERMRSIQRTLEHLAQACAGDSRPDCPILDDLAGGKRAA